MKILTLALLLSTVFQDGSVADKASGLFLIRGPNPNKQTRYGFIDATGKVIVDCQYDEALPFSEGLAAVKSGDLWGFIDTKGVLTVAAKFDSVRPFSEGLAAFKVQKESRWGYVDRQGTIVIPAKFREPSRCSDGMIRFPDEKTRRFGYLNKSGSVSIPPTYSLAQDFSDGLACVDDGTVIDKKGSIVFRTNGYGKPFSEGLAAFSTSSGVGYYLDKKGIVAIGAAAAPDSSGMIQLNSKNRQGADFWGGQSFSDGLACVKSVRAEVYGYIDHQGKFAIPARFYPATSFSEGLAFVEWKENGAGRRGYIDQTGQVMIPIEFGWKCEPFRGGLAYVVREMGGPYTERYIDRTGKTVWER